MSVRPFATVSEALATSFTGPATRALVEQYGTPSILEYKKQVATRILELEHDIRILKTCQNSTPTVNRLPPEILSQIFLHLFWTMEREYREDHKIFWILSTHVCRHWRAVALGCAALWTNFAFDMHGDLIRAILPWSKNLPLSVTLKCGGMTDIDALGEVLSQTARLRYLDLSPLPHPKPSRTDNIMHSLDPEFNKRYSPASCTAALARMGPSAPLLTTLSVSYANLKEDEHLPENFLKAAAPALKHLKFDNFDLLWSRIPFSKTLKTLHLGEAVSSCPEFPAMLETFKGLPRLERLTLRGMFPDRRFKRFPGMKPFTFGKKLKHLSLEDTGLAIGNFLLGIRVPKTTLIDIQFTGEEEWSQPNDSCVESIKELWRGDPLNWTKEEVYSLEISRNDMRPQFEFRFGNVPETLGWRYQLDEGVPHLTVRFPPYSHGTDPNLTFLASVQTHFDFTMLSTLHFNEDSELARNPVFESTFSRLPNLQLISFDRCDMTGFLHVLDDDPACNTIDGSSGPSTGVVPSAAVVPCFPALEAIEIFRKSFQKKRIDTIIRVLNKRRADHRLGTLQIYDCFNLDKADIARIEEGVPDIYVDWDGVMVRRKVNIFDESSSDGSDSEF
ncbi:hypothetical protein DFP72DRAFT_855609 [Ephemerocybe angulata]|uniref:F-box domain-containing protein n=1 Tax=Ephemerocybe angulata TaxID=980116 RepID=A0A8H6HHB4_9AGAR|nr:hypothetical protein DFP72DRAFT_855609 [Tulosesus angulatus]